MTDYSKLVKRLRRDGVAARDTLECVEMAPTVDPEDAIDAADAIEHLMSEIDFLDEHWRMNKKRIAELEAALKPFANVTPVLQEDDHGVIYEWALNCDDIHQARKVLEGK